MVDKYSYNLEEDDSKIESAESVYNIEEFEEESNSIANDKDQERKSVVEERIISEDSDEEEDTEYDDVTDDPQSWNGEIENHTISTWGVLWKLMMNPTEGVKALVRAKFPIEKVSFQLFYPLVILAGLAELTSLIYDVNVDIADLIIRIAFTAITFFFSYFTTILLCGLFLCKEARETFRSYKGKEFTMYCISMLALFYILYRIVPPAAPIIGFMPLWTVYTSFKGSRIFKVPKEKETNTIVTFCVILIGSILLWDWALDIIK